MPAYDLVVVGGGIDGLATAYQFTRCYPGRQVALKTEAYHLCRNLIYLQIGDAVVDRLAPRFG
jgi:hypothetical protein